MNTILYTHTHHTVLTIVSLKFWLSRFCVISNFQNYVLEYEQKNFFLSIITFNEIGDKVLAKWPT